MQPHKVKAAKTKDSPNARGKRAALAVSGAATKKSRPARPSEATASRSGGQRRGEPTGDYYRLMMNWSPLGLMLRQQALFARAWSGALQQHDLMNGRQPRKSRRA